MIKKSVQDAINKQINAEIYSSYMYYSMAFWFESQNLAGFAHWMRIQALEELMHAQKFAGFVTERGGRVLMAAVDKPPTEWKSPLHCVEEVYKHECKVTALINGLMDLALKEKDHASVSFFNWFIDEQVEEEAGADAIVQKLKLMKDHNGGLFMLDRELDARTFTPLPEIAGAF